jgi:hypothetical protein
MLGSLIVHWQQQATQQHHLLPAQLGCDAHATAWAAISNTTALQC